MSNNSDKNSPPIRQDIFDAAWNGWDFTALRSFFDRVKNDGSLLVGLLNPETKNPLTLEDIRIRGAITDTSTTRFFTSQTTSRFSTSVSSYLPLKQIKDFGFQKIYIDDSNFLGDLIKKRKYRNVGIHDSMNFPFNSLGHNEVLVLYMQQMSMPTIGKTYAVAVGSEEEFKFQYGGYSSGNFNFCEGFAVPYTEVEKFKIAG